VFILNLRFFLPSPVPEFIDPVLAKTSPKRSFSMTENERFGLAFAKTGSINSGTGTVGSHWHLTSLAIVCYLLFEEAIL
jgi:hypothetical protein